MNEAQRKILQGTLAAFGASILFPPFHFVAASFTTGLGFGFFLSWPEYNSMVGTVDVAFLLAEWVAISVVASILWALVRTDRAILGSIIGHIHSAAKRRSDATIEAARIAASSREHVANIMSGKS